VFLTVFDKQGILKKFDTSDYALNCTVKDGHHDQIFRASRIFFVFSSFSLLFQRDAMLARGICRRHVSVRPYIRLSVRQSQAGIT